jgi:hypothetical protein
VGGGAARLCSVQAEGILNAGGGMERPRAAASEHRREDGEQQAQMAGAGSHGLKQESGDPLGGRRCEPKRSSEKQNYFCQVRFLWRFRRSFLRRLCLLIFALRRFLSEPIFKMRHAVEESGAGMSICLSC